NDTSQVETGPVGDMARPVLSANCPSSDKTDDLPFIHARRNMSWNRKSRISKEGVSVEGFDHLVGYYHLSKQQKEVQFHHLLASVLTHLLHSVEFAKGASRPFSRACGKLPNNHMHRSRRNRFQLEGRHRRPSDAKFSSAIELISPSA